MSTEGREEGIGAFREAGGAVVEACSAGADGMVLGSADPLRATRKQRDKIGEARDGALPTTDFSDFGRPEIWRRCINHASSVNNQHRQQHSSPQRTTQIPRLGHYHEPPHALRSSHPGSDHIRPGPSATRGMALACRPTFSLAKQKAAAQHTRTLPSQKM